MLKWREQWEGGRDRVRGGERKQGCYAGTKRQWRKGGLREGVLMMETSEEGTPHTLPLLLTAYATAAKLRLASCYKKR